MIGRDLHAFLGRTYTLKAMADYETGPGANVSAAQATEAIAAASGFVAAIVGLLRFLPAPSSQTPDAPP